MTKYDNQNTTKKVILKKYQAEWLDKNNYKLSQFIRYLIDREILRGTLDKRFVEENKLPEIDNEELKER